jgi:hypothetical protein
VRIRKEEHIGCGRKRRKKILFKESGGGVQHNTQRNDAKMKIKPRCGDSVQCVLSLGSIKTQWEKAWPQARQGRGGE